MRDYKGEFRVWVKIVPGRVSVVGEIEAMDIDVIKASLEALEGRAAVCLSLWCRHREQVS